MPTPASSRADATSTCSIAERHEGRLVRRGQLASRVEGPLCPALERDAAPRARSGGGGQNSPHRQRRDHQTARPPGELRRVGPRRPYRPGGPTGRPESAARCRRDRLGSRAGRQGAIALRVAREARGVPRARTVAARGASRDPMGALRRREGRGARAARGDHAGGSSEECRSFGRRTLRVYGAFDGGRDRIHSRRFGGSTFLVAPDGLRA
jgi:hypothetical protein